MTLTLIAIGIAMACVLILVSAKRSRNRSELERHSISAEQLESLMASGQKVFLFDVLEMKISSFTVLVRVIRPADQFCIAH